MSNYAAAVDVRLIIFAHNYTETMKRLFFISVCACDELNFLSFFFLSWQFLSLWLRKFSCALFSVTLPWSSWRKCDGKCATIWTWIICCENFFHLKSVTWDKNKFKNEAAKSLFYTPHSILIHCWEKVFFERISTFWQQIRIAWKYFSLSIKLKLD